MICSVCNSTRFIAHQKIKIDIIIDENNNFIENMPAGIESSIYDSEKPYGPFTCCKCGAEYDSPGISSDGQDWYMTHDPFAYNNKKSYFRATDTYNTVFLSLQTHTGSGLYYKLYDKDMNLLDEGAVKNENVSHVKIAVNIFDRLTHLLDPDRYSFQQISDKQ